MTDVQKLMKLAEDWAMARSAYCLESMYGTSKSYTAKLLADAETARAALESALRQKAAEIERLKGALDTSVHGHNQIFELSKILEAERDALKAKLAEAEKQEPINQSLAEDIESIDTRHRGDPFYEHDAYWMRKAAADAVRKGYALYTRPAPSQDVNAGLVEALTKVRDRFFPKDQPERDRDLLWEPVNYALDAAALSSAQAAPARVVAEWQPIETAPKDGAEIIGFREDCGPLLIRWTSCSELMTDNEIEQSGIDEKTLFEEDWFYADFISGGRLEGTEEPTLWMPLPAAPQPKEGAKP